MDWYNIVKTAHILGSTILFGTGIGIAFFMFRSAFTDCMHEKLYATRNTVLADYIFTLPATIIQPATGFWLVWNGGYEWNETWLVTTYILYIVAGLCWLPVVWIQIQLKILVQESASGNAPLPTKYHKLFRLWFILGWPAFLGLIAVFYLMVTKPI